MTWGCERGENDSDVDNIAELMMCSGCLLPVAEKLFRPSLFGLRFPDVEVIPPFGNKIVKNYTSTT